jgi:hypothetical protein
VTHERRAAVNDSGKSKDELIAELIRLRQRLADVEPRKRLLADELLTDLKTVQARIRKLLKRVEVEWELHGRKAG